MPKGVTTASTWSALLSGRCGISALTASHASSLRFRTAGEVSSDLYDAPQLLSPMPLYAPFALHDPEATVLYAGLPRSRLGESLEDDALAADAHLYAARVRGVSPFLVPRILLSTPASLVSLAYRLCGPCLPPSTACAAGLHAMLDHARNRGFTAAYAEVRGSAATADAFHNTAPYPDGSCAGLPTLAFENARDMDYVNAHATSSPVGDTVERLAIVRLLGQDDRAVVSATKRSTGAEAAFTALPIASGRVRQNLNMERLDPDESVKNLGLGDIERYVPGTAMCKTEDMALRNSFCFGGANA